MKNTLCKISIALLTIILIFDFARPVTYAKSSNADLGSIEVSCGVLDPKFDSNETKYTLYIPSDLTQIVITPKPKNEAAMASKIDLTLAKNQEPDITIICTYKNEKKKYTVKIKRIDKTINEIENEIEKNGFAIYHTKPKFYQNKDFIVCISAVLIGIAVLVILYLIYRHKLINPYDENEKPFYASKKK